jgi:hypothetical protein
MKQFAVTISLIASILFATGTSFADDTAQSRRAHIENVTGSTLDSQGTDFHVTSRHRDDSPAHRRGAIDYRSNDVSEARRHADARAVSSALGSHHNVVVEEVYRPAGGVGPSAQRDTTYQGGWQGRTTWGPVRATDTHTHVQPNVRATPAR